MTTFITVGRGENRRQFTLPDEIVDIITEGLEEAWRAEPTGPTGERPRESGEKVGLIVDLKKALNDLKD